MARLCISGNHEPLGHPPLIRTDARSLFSHEEITSGSLRLRNFIRFAATGTSGDACGGVRKVLEGTVGIDIFSEA